MFAASALMVVTKIDLVPHLDIDIDRLIDNARRINPTIGVLKAFGKDRRRHGSLDALAGDRAGVSPCHRLGPSRSIRMNECATSTPIRASMLLGRVVCVCVSAAWCRALASARMFGGSPSAIISLDLP